MKVDYEKEYKKAISVNINSFKNSIKNVKDISDIPKRVISFSEKFDLEPFQVLSKIKNDEVFLYHFIKDPGRQNFHENLAAKYIKNIKEVLDFKQLAKSGVNSKTVLSGMINTGKNTSNKKTKTIDFEFDIINKNKEKIKIYVAHKHTKEAGGSQDNQYEDLKNFMENAKDNNEEKVYFLAIGDGAYYQIKNSKNINKIEELNNHYYKKRKLKAITIEELEDEIKKMISKSF